jgi:hypothetical protein
MLKIKPVKSLLMALLLLSFVACEPYEDYIKDFDYSAVYFGTQKPLRTLVTRQDKDQLEFKLGVVLAGLRENKNGHWATFEIDTVLLDSIPGATGFTLLPADWYKFSISENKIEIPKGKFLGDFTISIDKAKFTADPLSLTKKYALPVRLIETSADSVLRGNDVVARRDYTILVVKYINEFSGTYYVRGEQVELDINGNPVETTRNEYYHVDWIKNKTRVLTTTALDDCEMTGIGIQTSDKVKVTFGADHAVTLSTVTIPVTDRGCSYADGIYRFQYEYTKGGKTYRVDEYLKQRNDPENDLRFEEW